MDKNNTSFALFHETMLLIDDLSLFLLLLLLLLLLLFYIQMKNDILNG